MGKEAGVVVAGVVTGAVVVGGFVFGALRASAGKACLYEPEIPAL